MPSVSPVSTTLTPTPAGDDTPGSLRVPQKVLGQHDFLKLLSVQFTMQDPMKPREDTAFIAQMAQFSSLEQSGAMSKEMTAMRGEQVRATANSYLGHRVTVESDDGTLVTGDVSAVDTTTAQPHLVVNGQLYPLFAVLRVEPSVVSAPAPQPANPGGAQS